GWTRCAPAGHARAPPVPSAAGPPRSRRRRFRCPGPASSCRALKILCYPRYNSRLTIFHCPARAGRLSPGVSMPNVKVRENEPFEIALRRFKRTCEKAGVLAETRKREFYEKPTQERKRKRAAAVKRHLRRLSRDVSRKVRLY